MTITTSPDRHVSDTPTRTVGQVSDTPRRVSDTPDWLSDTPHRRVRQVSDTPRQVSDTARRARRQATAVAAFGAVVPTVLAAQGMTYLAIDLLGFPVLAAVALASFLELALVSSALLARAAALAGRPGGADTIAVWVVSATSGLLAGVHELVATTPDGGSTWTTDPGSWLAAAVRAVAPLVAAWLWERVLQAARAEQAERTLAEVRRDRRFLEVGRRALAVRRLETAGRATWRVRRARRRLDRAHLAALRSAPPVAELLAVLAAVGQVDVLPDATRPVSDTTEQVSDTPDTTTRHASDSQPPEPRQPDTPAEPQARVSDTPAPVSDRPAEGVRHLSDTPDQVSDTPTPGVRHLSDTARQVSDSTPPVTAAIDTWTPTAADVSDTHGEVSDTPTPAVRQVSDTPVRPVRHLSDTLSLVSDTPRPVSDTPDETSDPSTSLAPLTVALELVRADRSVSGARVADELARHGVPVSERTGLRWRNRALDLLATS